MYITPLQDELDTAPLPPSSDAFRNMPKALCKKCNISFPLQVLTNHIKTCSDVVLIEDENERQDEAGCVQDVESVKKNNERVIALCTVHILLNIFQPKAIKKGQFQTEGEKSPFLMCFLYG